MAQSNRKIDSKAYPIGELFRRGVFYRVPVYQRDFAWTIEQVDTLWEDLVTALNDNRSEYFLGAVVISHTEEDKQRDIIDGQQRLSAISMIFAAISYAWEGIGDTSRSIGVARDYLGSEDRRTKETISKLTLNETNDSFFQSVIIGRHMPNNTDRKTWGHSNKLLVEAFERITELLKILLSTETDKEAKLLELEDFIADKTYVIVIEAGDESDAFITFETLNDRGLDLAISDLVKNFLFSKASGNIDKFKKFWTEIVLLVGGENMTQFLRYFWNAEYETARERDLYKSIKNTIRNSSSARQMIEKLRKSADLYAALSNPEHSYWLDFSGEYRNYLNALLLFKVTQFRPIALAAMDKLKPEKMTGLLRMLMISSFRYTVISSLNTGNLDKVYSKTALAISSGGVSGLKDIFELLKPVYVDDQRFEVDFQQRSFTKDDIARYVLTEMNSQIERDVEHTATERSGVLTLEHIFPKSPKEAWKPYIPKDKEISDFVYLIGNLTLLEKAKNRNIGNISFEEKKEKAFEPSTLAINKDIASSSVWDIASIEHRSRKFAKLARTIWRLDY
jgi:uncharacterized protein with ParB-like and HNH nuclease domain